MSPDISLARCKRTGSMSDRKRKWHHEGCLLRLGPSFLIGTSHSMPHSALVEGPSVSRWMRVGTIMHNLEALAAAVAECNQQLQVKLGSPAKAREMVQVV